MAKKVTFILAPEIVGESNGGMVLGEFNNWNAEEGLALKKQKDGSLQASTLLEGGRAYQYRYLLNDGRWVNDGNAGNYASDYQYQVENCVIEVPVEETKAVAKKVSAKKEAVKKPVEKKEASKKAAAPKAAAPTKIEPVVTAPLMTVETPKKAKAKKSKDSEPAKASKKSSSKK